MRDVAAFFVGLEEARDADEHRGRADEAVQDRDEAPGIDVIATRAARNAPTSAPSAIAKPSTPTLSTSEPEEIPTRSISA